ncbi:MAG TPA: biotin--[acetyl-CoA-carboxylase] ligase [Humisphaera sp.]|nr:biotin--[acetyl-CoA-carboxylase] ligase [Humisphaera sp.]
MHNAPGEFPIRRQTFNSFDLARARAGVEPFRLHWFARLRSTNDHAAVLRKHGKLFAPAIVLTSHQTAGRGRGSHVWWSAAGGLTVTFVFPNDPQIAPHQVPLLAGLAARNAVAELLGDNGVQLKWPNDLLYGGKKLGGLLCERILKVDLVGLGINVNLDANSAPKHLLGQITSMYSIAGRRFEMTDVLIALSRHLHGTISRGGERPFAEMLREYDAHHALRGRMVSVTAGDGDPPLRGKCEGLDTMGRLLLRSRTKLHHIISGQVASV